MPSPPITNIMKTLTIGIMSQDKIREHVLAIAKGDITPVENESKIWFTSIRSLAEVLSDENRALLKVIFDCNVRAVASTNRVLLEVTEKISVLDYRTFWYAFPQYFARMRWIVHSAHFKTSSTSTKAHVAFW